MAELESELCAELPERNLMRRHKRFSRRHHFSTRHGFSGAHASFGSAAASNSTTQVNFNPQIVINNGRVGGGVNLSSHNANFNTTNQNLVPINFG
jgi:hypothetical protein